jgi:serine/threonine-protein kinase
VLYLRALPYEQGPDTSLQDYKRAEQLLNQAIALDPNFALAHAHLGSTCAEVYHFWEPLETWKTKARTAAETALRLQPNLAEGHLALGQCTYWIDANYEQALTEFGLAQRLAPSNSSIGLLVAAIQRRQGKWEECLAGFERVQDLDPQNSNVVRNLLFTNSALRRWPAAAKAAERFEALAPDSVVAKQQMGYVQFQWKGNTAAVSAAMAGISPGEDPDGEVTSSNWDGAMLQRDFIRAAKILESSPLTEVSYLNGGLTPKSFLAGGTALALGDQERAREDLDAARKLFESAVAEAPEAAERHANLGICYAFIGQKENAIREGMRAVELKPETSDATDGAGISACLALIYARLAEKDLAIPLIERLLKTPGAVDSVFYSITVNDLKYRWEWDPIRSDPRFQKLLAAE